MGVRPHIGADVRALHSINNGMGVGVDVTGEHLGVMPTDTGVDFSEPNQGYCDGCLSTIETFHLQWLRYVSKESVEGDEIDQKSAGSAPPAITYNDEVEDMVVSSRTVCAAETSLSR